MALEFVAIRRGHMLALTPADPESEAVMAGIPTGRPVRIRATVANIRSVQRNRWFHALCSKIADGMADSAWTTETVKLFLKLRTGLVDMFEHDGRTVAVPRSTAFGRMREAEFVAFCDRSVDVAVAELLPGVDRADLRREIGRLIGGDV